MGNSQRQQELRVQITALDSQRANLTTEIKDLINRREEHARELDQMKQLHMEACRLEALGQPSEFRKIEREIASTSAKLSGTETLITEKEAERQRIGAEAIPLERELQQMIAAEARERALAEIQAELDQGKRDLKEFFKLQTRHDARIALLMSRREREADSFVASSAARVAELLRNAGAGIRVGDLFTREDFKELAAFGKRFG